MVNERKSYKVFTFAIVIFPILSMYSTPGLNFLPLCDTILLLSIIFSIHKSYVPKLNYWVFLPIIMTILLSIFSFIWNGLDNDGLFKLFHFIFSLFISSFFIDDWFNFSSAFRYFRNISIFSSIFLIFQNFVLYVFGNYISGSIPFLTIANEEIIKFNNSALIGSRVRSIFSEPAAFVNFIAIYLAIEIFDKRHKKNVLLIFFLIGSIILSKSSTGYLFLGIIGLFWLIEYIKKPDFQKSIVILVSSISVPIFLIGTGSLSFVIEHLFGNGKLGQGVGFINRFQGYSIIFDFKQYDLFQIFFGIGMVKTDIFITAVAKLFLFFGIIGSIFTIWYLIASFLKLNVAGKCILFMVVFNAFFADSLFGIASISYLPYLLKLKKGDDW